MDLGPWEKPVAAVAALIVAVLGGLGYRASRHRSGEPPGLRSLRDRLDEHIEEDIKAHERLAALEQALLATSRDLARALRHVDESASGYQRLALLEAALTEVRRYAEALYGRIEREHALMGDLRTEHGYTQERVAVLEALLRNNRGRR